MGLDYHAGVYRVVSEQGTAYLLKVTSRPLYESGCLAPGYLNEQGITSAVAPVPTSSGALLYRTVGFLASVLLVEIDKLLLHLPGMEAVLLVVRVQ